MRQGQAHWQVSQPLASFLVPLGHIGSQPSAGHAVPPPLPPVGGGPIGGGTQPVLGSVPPQSQLQGGQFIVVGSHPGQPHAQPPPLPPVPPPPAPFGDWHTPDTQG